MNKSKANKAITGFFATMGNETNETFTKGKIVQSGRSGVYYTSKDLVTIINDNPAINKGDITIVKVEVPKNAITNKNGIRFRIKGKSAKVLETKDFSAVAKKVMAVA